MPLLTNCLGMEGDAVMRSNNVEMHSSKGSSCSMDVRSELQVCAPLFVCVCVMCECVPLIPMFQLANSNKAISHII